MRKKVPIAINRSQDGADVRGLPNVLTSRPISYLTESKSKIILSTIPWWKRILRIGYRKHKIVKSSPPDFKGLPKTP